MAVNTGNNDKVHSIPHIQNMGFDRDFQVPMVELLVYDPLENAIKRVTTDAMGTYKTNDVTNTAESPYYVGKEEADGSWYIMKVTDTAGAMSMRYASVKNNVSYTNYTNAWTDKATLTYGTYAEAFS